MSTGGPFDTVPFTTDNLRVKATARYSVGITDWRVAWGTDGIALNSIAHPIDPRYQFGSIWYETYQRALTIATGDYGVWREEEKWG